MTLQPHQLRDYADLWDEFLATAGPSWSDFIRQRADAREGEKAASDPGCLPWPSGFARGGVWSGPRTELPDDVAMVRLRRFEPNDPVARAALRMIAALTARAETLERMSGDARGRVFGLREAAFKARALGGASGDEVARELHRIADSLERETPR